MSNPLRCDACGKRLRKNPHELLLSDLLTGQVVGHYHGGLAWPKCMARVGVYLKEGKALRASFLHPDRCGDTQEYCDGRLMEVASA